MMSMDNQMEPMCVICLETFNQSRKALSLACGHSYCNICSKKMLKENCITCPEVGIFIYVALCFLIIFN